MRSKTTIESINFSSTQVHIEPSSVSDHGDPNQPCQALDDAEYVLYLGEEEMNGILGDEVSEFQQIRDQILHEQASPEPAQAVVLLVSEVTDASDILTMEQKKLAKGVITTDQLTQSDYSDPISQVQTGRTMQLMVPLEPNQRARYEKELLRDLRFISVENEGTMTLQIPDLRRVIQQVPYLRITRTTVPYGINRVLLVHPYPLWIKDLQASVHHGSLFIRISDQMMENGQINLDKLLMERLKQGVLSAMQQWRIHTSSRLDFTEWYPINIPKAKDMISEFRLRESILYFQIFLMDVNQNASATDLICHTERIREYVGNEITSLPSNDRSTKRHETKRLQKSWNKLPTSKARRTSKE